MLRSRALDRIETAEPQLPSLFRYPVAQDNRSRQWCGLGRTIGQPWGSHGPAMGQYGHVEEVGMVIHTWNARRVATACLRAAHVPRDGLGSRCAPFELTE